MDKILTVVIPTYNMEKYLDKCLSSLIVDDSELLLRLEVLVVIDGAKDHSSEIAHRYQELYPQTFVVIDKENGNYGSCINRGLKEARGKYIKILDADDSFNTISFERYLKSLLNSDVDLVINNYTIVNENGLSVSKHHRDLKDFVVYNNDDILPYLSSSYLVMHEVAYRVSMLRDNNYTQTEGISYTDQEWVLFPIAWSKSILYIDENIYLYLIGREGQTVSANAALKNISHFEIRIANTISLYNSFPNKTDLSGQYLRKRIISESERVYLRYIFIGRRIVDENGLFIFDKKIKELNHDIYNALNDEKLMGIFPIYHIREWRNKHYKKIKHFYFIIDLLLLYKSYMFKVKSLFAK